MADHAGHLGIDQLLRDRGPDFRIGLVVFGDEHELRVLAVDLDLGRIGLVDRQARAVLVVLAQVRDAAGQRPDMADLDFNRRRGRWGRLNCGLGRFGLLVFATAGQGYRGGCSKQSECESGVPRAGVLHTTS